MAEDLVIATTTDVPASADAAASGAPEEDSRADVSESNLADFRESTSDDGRTTTTTYENPSSERQALLERLAEAEAEIQLPQEESTEQGQTVDESQLGIDIEAVRRAATADAIAEGRRRMGVSASQDNPTTAAQAEAQRLTTEAVQRFATRLDQIRPDNWQQLGEEVRADNVHFDPQIAEALIHLPGGPEAVMHLARNRTEAKEIAALPVSIGLARIGGLCARCAQPAKARSNAPKPIEPVMGGARMSRSISDPDISFPEYCQLRDEQRRRSLRR